MKIYLIGEELDEVLLRYIFAFHIRDEVVICGTINNIRYLNMLTMFNVSFTDDNHMSLGIGDIKDFSDGVILTLQAIEVVFSKLFKRDLLNYCFKIQNVITGDVHSSLWYLKGYRKIEASLINILSDKNIANLLDLRNSEVSKICNADISDINFEKSDDVSEVYFSISDTSIVPKAKGFISSDISDYDFKFSLNSETSRSFDRRFLRTTLTPIESVLVRTSNVPNLKQHRKFPYNLLIDSSSITLPSDDGVIELILKDFIYNCFRYKVCPSIYLTSDNEDIVTHLDYLGYPIELIKTWRFDYNE